MNPHGLSQEKMAHFLNVDQRTFRTYETMKKAPKTNITKSPISNNVDFALL